MAAGLQTWITTWGDKRLDYVSLNGMHDVRQPVETVITWSGYVLKTGHDRTAEGHPCVRCGSCDKRVYLRAVLKKEFE